VLELCADPSEAVRRAAIEHLPFFDDRRATAVLVHALGFDTPVVRAAAATALARLEEDAALPPLIRALDDADPWVRYFALRSIGAFENATAAPAVVKVLERDRAGQVRLAAIDALGRLDPPDAVTILQPLTVSSDADLARAAIRALGHIKDARAQPILASLGRAAEAWRRLEAVAAIGVRGGAEAASTLQWVAAADTEADVSGAAIAALAVIGSRGGPDAISAITALIALTAERAIRETVIASLAGLPAHRIGDVASGLGHPSPDVRRAVIEALGRMRRPDASGWVERALEDAVPAVRAAAVGELRRLGSRTAAKTLLRLARTDPDSGVRHAAVMAVTQQPPDLSADRLEGG
jgi:HEAT repeat protein